MANNRLYLKFKPTGEKFLLAKRMGDGWYLRAGFTEENLNAFFDGCWNSVNAKESFGRITEEHPDDFEVELEIPVKENNPMIL